VNNAGALHTFLTNIHKSRLFERSLRRLIIDLDKSMKAVASFGKDGLYSKINQRRSVPQAPVFRGHAHVDFALSVGAPVHAKLPNGTTLAILGK
jgi:hypothetical protein